MSVKGFIPAGHVGLGLGASIMLTTYLKFAVRLAATVEAQMNSVDRVKYYTNNIPVDGYKVTYPDSEFFNEAFGRSLPQPKAATTKEFAEVTGTTNVATNKLGVKPNYITPAANWPKEGSIDCRDIFLRYRDGPVVLTGLNFAVKAGEKIGVVGRTG